MASASSSTSMVRNPSHAAHICGQMKSFYNSKILVDVILSSNGQTLDCHKVALAISSSFFQKLFADRKEEGVNIVDLSMIDVEILKTLITFIYSGTCKVTPSTVQLLVSGALTLKLHLFIHACTDYIKQHMTVDNVMFYYQKIQDDRYKDLKGHVRQFMQYNFIELCNSNQLNDMSVPAVVEILQPEVAGACSMDSQIADNNIMMKKIITWVDAGQTSDVDLVPLFEVVRFEMLTADYLGELQDHPAMQKPPQVHYVRAAIKHHLK